MRVSPSPLGVLALVAICGATVVVPRLAGWLPADRTIELAALAFLSILSSFLRVQQSATKDRAIMAPSFIVTVSALLMFGPHVAALVAAAGALAPSFLVSERPYPRAHSLIDAAVTVLATAAAGQAYQALTTISTAVTGVWPWQAASHRRGRPLLCRRAGRARRDHRAVRVAAARESLVAQGGAPRLLRLSRRGERRGRPGRADRPADVGSPVRWPRRRCSFSTASTTTM